MPLQYTIPNYITFGEVTVYLMGNYEAEGAIWGARLLWYQSPVLVAAVTDFLAWEWERQLAEVEFNAPDKIGVNNVDVLGVNSIDILGVN